MNISFLTEKGNKYFIYILVGVLILVVLFPTNSGLETKKETSAQQMTAEGEIEGQLKKVLSAMEGVGVVEVMIAQENIQNSMFDKSQKVSGVVVVAEGAGVPSVDARILEAVKALFSVDVHKISIVKMRSQEGDK